MSTILSSIRAEYGRYRRLGESALEQVADDRLAELPHPGANSLAILMWHMAGNLESRFTDFLQSDGEKPWRHRDTEFEERDPSRDELLAKWNRGWECLDAALDELEERDLERTVTIRGQPLSVIEALHRSLAHAAYHVGQIVLLARSHAGQRWESLSIPRRGSDDYNRNPTHERG